jgi:AcrR family transcriptional regulator
MSPQPDRRVRRTRDTLHQSLVALILEKGYERITVQDILDRADVGRSTFYTHYQGKDDLLLSGFDELRSAFAAEARTAPDELLRPMRALFRHVDENRALHRALVGRRELAIRPLRTDLADVLTEHLRPHLRIDERELDRTVAFVISGLTGLVGWWLDTGAPFTADEMYQRFRELAMHGIEPQRVVSVEECQRPLS